jgi:hypothetical protein
VLRYLYGQSRIRLGRAASMREPDDELPARLGKGLEGLPHMLGARIELLPFGQNGRLPVR